jgi:hypothetical protein
MQVLAMLSARPGSGQITVLVNLASGLVRQGKRVLIGQLGPSRKLMDWLGVAADGNLCGSDLAGTRDTVANQIRTARFGLDMLNIPVSSAEQNFLEMLQPVLTQLGYAYLILNLTAPEAGAFIPPRARLLVCTDLQGENEVTEIQELLRILQSHNQTELLQTGGEDFPDISLIIPNRINNKDWAYNNGQLSALGEHFGYAKLVDPLPT